MKPEILGGEVLFSVIAVLALAAVIIYRYFYRREAEQNRQLSPRQRRILWALRAIVAVLALMAITRPAVYWKKVKERLPVVAFLVDESRSMGFTDTRDNPMIRSVTSTERKRYNTCKKVLEKLQNDLTLTHRVKVFTFSDTMKLLKELPFRDDDDEPVLKIEEIFSDRPEPTGEYTNIGDALSDVMRNLSSDKISGVVLATDGRQTGGRDIQTAAQQAAAAKVPIHTVVTGTEFPLRDLRIDEVNVDPEGNLGDVVIFDLKVTNQISSRLSTELSLYEQGKKIGTKSVVLERGTSNVTMAMIPENTGEREFKLEFPVYPDELSDENNVAEVTVKIIKRTINVILIASKATREYFYMVPCLLRDPVIRMSCFLQTADVDYVQQGNTSDPLEALPKTLDEWSKDYDVVILFDADPNKLSTQQVTAIENMVRKGGGLVILAGRNYGLAKFIQVHAVRIRNLLPVEIDKNVLPNYFKKFPEPFSVERTPVGKGHPIMLASNDPQTNEEVWKTFPSFFWHHPVKHVKTNAITLLQKAEGGGSTTCLMATQRYGEGAVFYSGINSLWRWRYPFESFEYDRLWVRVIRYLGESKLKGGSQQVALSTDDTVYAPGENVGIRLRILDPALMAQLRGVPVYASVTSPDKDKRMIRLKPDPRGEMRYDGNYRARRVGKMTVHCSQSAPETDTEAKALFDLKHSFMVKMESLEWKDTSSDLDAMKDLAGDTNGEYFDYRNMNEIQSLIDKIPAAPQRISETVLVELWDGLVFLILLIVLLSGEWSLRKLWGLL